jgi:hypothetical protein
MIRRDGPHPWSIAQARSNGNNARVWGGMHYPSTVAISDSMGETIADYVNLNSMQRRHGARASAPAVGRRTCDFSTSHFSYPGHPFLGE